MVIKAAMITRSATSTGLSATSIATNGQEVGRTLPRTRPIQRVACRVKRTLTHADHWRVLNGSSGPNSGTRIWPTGRCWRHTGLDEALGSVCEAASR